MAIFPAIRTHRDTTRWCVEIGDTDFMRGWTSAMMSRPEAERLYYEMSGRGLPVVLYECTEVMRNG